MNESESFIYLHSGSATVSQLNHINQSPLNWHDCFMESENDQKLLELVKQYSMHWNVPLYMNIYIQRKLHKLLGRCGKRVWKTILYVNEKKIAVVNEMWMCKSMMHKLFSVCECVKG